jgi:hypothetical protein
MAGFVFLSGFFEPPAVIYLPWIKKDRRYFVSTEACA